MDKNQDTEEQATKSLDYVAMLRSRWKEILAIFMLVVAVTIVVTFLMPKSYMATTKFTIVQPQSLVQVGKEMEVVEKLASSANYLNTNISLITSPEVLKKVAVHLNLASEFGLPNESVVRILQDMVKVEPEKMTDVVNIIVTGSDPKMVENIAKAVPIAYQKDREERENNIVGKTIQGLKDIIEKQKSEVQIKLDKYLESVNKHGVYVMTLDTPGSSQTYNTDMTEQEFRNAIENSQEIDKQIKDLESHLNSLKKIDDNELLEYVVSADLLSVEGIGSASLREMYKQYEDKSREREELVARNLGKKHPSMLAVTQTEALLREKLDKAVGGFRGIIEQKLEILKRNLQDWRDLSSEKKKEMTARMQITPEIEQLKREYDSALDQFREMDIKYKDQEARLRVQRVSVEVYGFPSLPTEPYKPKFMVNLAIGCGAGLLLGCLVAFLLEVSDTSVRTMDEVEKALSVPVIGVIPKNVGSLFTTGDDNVMDAEAYRILRTNIEFNRGNKRELVMTCVSASAGEGKTTTICNLGYVCSQAGYATILLDADLRRSKLHRHFEISNDKGLSSYLVDNARLEDIVFKTQADNFYIMPAGPTLFDPSGALNSAKFKELLVELRSRFDIILIDSPPILGVSDSSVIVSECDMTFMVVQPRKLPVKALLRAKHVIESVHGNLVGVVMNNVNLSSDHQYQYYTTYYSYHQEDKSNGNGLSYETNAVAKSNKAQDLVDVKTSSNSSEDLY